MKTDTKTVNLITKFGNTLMIHGEKKTGEKIILKFAKRLQKTTNKNIKNIIQLSIINTTSTFKINEQVVKKGKRKSTRFNPSFLKNELLRIATTLKTLKSVVSKNQKAAYFYEKFTNEVLASVNLKGQSVDRKNEIQKQIITNKKYFSKFRW